LLGCGWCGALFDVLSLLEVVDLVWVDTPFLEQMLIVTKTLQ
jgi:hypothetical protein